MQGTAFGRYTLLELIGRGGMGEVWRAHDPAVDRVVALKVLSPNVAGDEVYEERFRREARAAAGLDEPHVVPIFDFGEVEGRLYVTMRLIQGKDLQTMLREGPLAPERAVTIVEQIAAALHAAHRIGLVHRDVKPSNIRVAENDFAYLIDFGIAHAAGESGLTSTGAAIGTWAYMAPERFSTGQADPRSDIYALTCVLYECLTGHQPFGGTSAEQQLAGHLAAPPPRPSLTQPGVPPAFDAVIATGMAKDPDQRYQTTLALARAARAALTAPTIPIPQPTEPAPTTAAPPPPLFGPEAATAVHAGVAPAARPPTLSPEPPVPRRRWSRRTVLLAAAAAAVVIAAGIVAGITLSNRPEQEPNVDRQTPIASNPPSGPTQAPSPSASAPMSLTGRWSGPVSGDQSGFDVVADIVDKPPLTATVTYPQLSCGGTWTQHGSAGNGVRFVTENITYGGCVQSEVTLTPQHDGTLYFSSTYYSASRQRNLTIDATLRR